MGFPSKEVSVSLGENAVNISVSERPSVVLDTLCFVALSHRDNHLSYQNKNYQCFVVNVGNPHIIIFIDQNPYQEDTNILNGLHHLAISTYGDDYNISFVCVDLQKDLPKDPENSSRAMRIRTFERGVGETDSCASAAVASVYAYNTIFSSEKYFTMYPRLGSLDIRVDEMMVVVEGSPCFVFQADIDKERYLEYGDWNRSVHENESIGY